MIKTNGRSGGSVGARVAAVSAAFLAVVAMAMPAFADDRHRGSPHHGHRWVPPGHAKHHAKHYHRHHHVRPYYVAPVHAYAPPVVYVPAPVYRPAPSLTVVIPLDF